MGRVGRKLCAQAQARPPPGLQVEGLSGLTDLMFLDLSHNRLAALDPAALPPGLSFLKVTGRLLAGAGERGGGRVGLGHMSVRAACGRKGGVGEVWAGAAGAWCGCRCGTCAAVGRADVQDGRKARAGRAPTGAALGHGQQQHVARS